MGGDAAGTRIPGWPAGRGSLRGRRRRAGTGRTRSRERGRARRGRKPVSDREARYGGVRTSLGLIPVNANRQIGMTNGGGPLLHVRRGDNVIHQGKPHGPDGPWGFFVRTAAGPLFLPRSGGRSEARSEELEAQAGDPVLATVVEIDRYRGRDRHGRAHTPPCIRVAEQRQPVSTSERATAHTVAIANPAMLDTSGIAIMALSPGSVRRSIPSPTRPPPSAPRFISRTR